MEVDLPELADQLLFAPIRKLLSTITGLPESTWPTVPHIISGIQAFFGNIGASFADLLSAFQGTYTGTDPALGTIQTIVKALRGGLTGPIDWSRIPQLSLSQLTNQPGPNLLSGFGDFASEDTMDGGGDWTWDGTVGGGSARATGSGARKVLTSELVAVSEGQQMSAAGKVRWSGASGTGAAMQLIVMPFVGDTAQAEVVISNIASPPASSSGNFVALSGSYTPAAGVTGVRVRITVEAALTAGTVWWDNVTLRKVATSLPQQFISGLEGALSQLGADVNAALGWIKDLIQRITGRARTTLEDALTDAATFATQLRTLLLGGSVSSPLPNLTSLVQLGQSQITNLVSDLGGKASTAAVNTINTFIQNLVDAILQAIRKVPVVGGSIADIIADVGGLKDTADTAQQQISTGVSGQVVTAGLLDGQQFTLTSFTTPGLATFTPPAPPSGYEIDYYIVTCYGGGQGGGRSLAGGPGGIDGGRTTRRLTPAQVGSSQSVTVGAGGSGATGDGYGSMGGASSFGALVASVAGTSSAAPTPYGDLPSSARPGRGGDGGSKVLALVDSATDTTNLGSHSHNISNPGSSSSTTTTNLGAHSHTLGTTFVYMPGDAGESSSGATGGTAGRSGNGWWGSGSSPGAGAAGTSNGYATSGGGGGGGGGGSASGGQAGAVGGAPGGGGGGGGAGNGTIALLPGNGGSGGRGQVDILAVYKPTAA